MITLIKLTFELFLIPTLFLISIISRFKKKNAVIGLGPDPLINNYYHKKALELYGYSAETFVKSSYHITDKFDIDVSKKFNLNSTIYQALAYIYLIVASFKYKVLYMSFNGGAIGLRSIIIWKIEPLLYKLAKIKTVILPYGSDVQDLTRSPNLIFKDSIANDYPDYKLNRKMVNQKIDLWTKYADHIIGGCEWVDYMYHWDTLMLAHFSIDMEKFKRKVPTLNKDEQNLKVLHAPNHRHIKGSEFLIKAIQELRGEGYNLELIIVEKKSNEEILQLIQGVDIVADQFIIGWYAMFAIEAMASSKPVLGYLRSDLIDLYASKGLVGQGEIPIINASIFNIKEKLMWCIKNRDCLSEIGERSYEYVNKHHSIKSVGSVFNKVNKMLEI